jgi:hypothetical protein
MSLVKMECQSFGVRNSENGEWGTSTNCVINVQVSPTLCDSWISKSYYVTHNF